LSVMLGRYEKRLSQNMEFKEIAVKESELSDAFMFMAANVDFGERFLSDPNVRRSLRKAKNFVKRLSLSQHNSWVHLIAELKEESLRPILNLVLSCGEALS